MMTRKPEIRSVLLETLRGELGALRLWQQEPELTVVPMPSCVFSTNNADEKGGMQ